MNGKVSEKLKAKSQKQDWPITVEKWDALHLENFENESIDKIVTDPPWGLHLGKHLDLQMFYSKIKRI